MKIFIKSLGLVIAILTLLLLVSALSIAQNPFPLKSIKDIQWVHPDSLRKADSLQAVGVAFNSTTFPHWIEDSRYWHVPPISSTQYGDTFTVVGIVMNKPQIYLLGNRYVVFIQDTAGGPWSGIIVLANDTTSSNTQATGIQVLDTGMVVKIVGRVEEFPATSSTGYTELFTVIPDPRTGQIIPIEVLDWKPQRPDPIEVRISDFVTGNASAGGHKINFSNGEKWEDVYVVIKNVSVVNRSGTVGGRWAWWVGDDSGNVIQVYDGSRYFRGGSGAFDPNWTPPPIGTKLEYIRGVIVGMGSGYAITPLYPGDVKILGDEHVPATPIQWSIKISARVDSLSDLNNFAAVHSQASDSLDPYDIPKPPAPNSNYVYLYFPHPEWGGILGPNYSKDTRRARDLTNETIEWLFNVKTDQTGKNVLLEFNPDSLFPSNYTIVLYDLDAGIRKVLSQSDNTYTYNSGSGAERHFKLVVGGLFKTRNFQAGWNLVGIPLSIDSTLSSMFSDDVSTFYIYTYTFKEGYKIDTTFTLGKGFWLGLLDSAVVDFLGIPVKDTISTNLDKYWNIISTPYLTPITKGNIFVERSGFKIPFDSAVSSGWISSALFGYDPRTKSYYLSDTLEPWLGYWFATLKDSLNIIYTPPSTAPSPKVIFADVKSDDRNWNVILSARLGEVLDKLAFFGIREGASDGIDRFDYPKPPLPPGEKTIQVYFYHPEWNFELGPYFASDIRAYFGDVKSWKFYVRCLSGGEVKLSWDLSQVPGRFNFTLFDVSSGRVVDMRSVSEYVYNAVNNETREFRIDAVTGVSEENTIPKSYALYQNYPNPFNPSTTIEFDIPERTNVKLVVYDILGREVETLIDKELEPGKYKLNFNATNLPSGVYFYTLRTPKFTKTNKMLLIK
jgi:hypothetical protein